MFQRADVILVVVHGLVIAGFLFLHLPAEAFRLVFGIVQLRETVGDLPPADKEFKAVGYKRVIIITPCQG